VRRKLSPTAPGPARMWRAAALLAAGVVLGGCATKPLPYSGPIDVKSVEVSIQEVPPPEVYYHRRQPPGVLGYLGTAAFMGSTIYRSWADSEKTDEVVSYLKRIEPTEEVVGSFVKTLREARVFRRVDHRGASRAGGPHDAFIELMIDRWGLTYATEGQVAAEVVVVGRMRPTRQGEELLWRRRIVETDGARLNLEGLDAAGQVAQDALRRTLRAAGVDLANDLLGPQKPPPKPKELLPPEM
jgi:hypothetical protein